jgi:nicotinate-nucleotide pyrophosphorylase
MRATGLAESRRCGEKIDDEFEIMVGAGIGLVRRVRARNPRPLVEVSGGVTLARLPELARAGVDLASVGALTHSARAVDLALDVKVQAA